MSVSITFNVLPPERIELSAFGLLGLDYETNALPLSEEGFTIYKDCNKNFYLLAYDQQKEMNEK